MNSKYKVTKFSSKNFSDTEDLISIEEPLEISLKYKSEDEWINENLYISLINTYIDPSKPVENAIITHGHADHAKPGHKNVLATKETINIMKIRYGENCAENFQELPLNRTLKIDNVKITFYPAGHILGSVQVLAEYKGERINFTGDYKTKKDKTCENFEPVKCHTLVTEATFGLPVFQHPNEHNEIKKLLRSLELFPKRPHLVGVCLLYTSDAADE